MRRADTHVCSAVISDLTFDARVWKEVGSLIASGHRVTLVGCGYGDVRPEAQEDGARVLRVSFGPREGATSYRRRALILLHVWLKVARVQARVYHAHNIHVGPPMWLLARWRRARLVYDAHELYGEASSSRLGHRLVARLALAVERFMVRRSDAVITTNPSRAIALEARHGRGDVLVLANVPRIVDPLIAVDPGYPARRPILLYQGGIYARSRAFRETLEALRELPEVEFVVLGFGRPADLTAVRSWATELGVNDRVHLLPPRPFGELIATAAAADVGLVPIKPDNLNHRLGDTNKLFEYLMAGIPVAGSNLPEIARVLGDGQPSVGEVFDAEDPASIARAVRSILATPAAERPREARRLALEQYNWDVEERRLIYLYRDLLAR